MRSVIALCSAALVLSAAPAVADSDSLAQRADAAAAAARLSAKVSSAQANATIAFLVPLRVSNPRIGSRFGLDVVDAATGERLYSRMADTPLRPASNMKIVTALTALKVLGPDNRMTTDTLVPEKGTVILRGGGDTTLGSDELTRLARATAKYLRTNALLPDRVQPPDYRPKTCTVDGKTRKSTTKRPCPLVTPPTKRPAVKVLVDDSLYGKPKKGPGWTNSYQPYIARPVRPLGRIGVYQWDAAGEAASVFTSALRARGVKARTKGRVKTPDTATVAAQVTGDTVAAQVRYMMQVSENNIAEMLFRQVAVERGRKGTFKGGRLAARDTLRELGLDTAGLQLKDGSGLSRTDRLTPRFVTDLLGVALQTDEHPEFDSFLSSLPIGGRTGTLSAGTGRYTTNPSKCAAGQVFAKTGTLFDTIGLSGYTKGADGELKIFSALVNNRPQSYSPLSTRQAVDGIVATVNGCWGPTKKTGEPPNVG
ncbi:MAG: D-alanyl-D-alanine carboxypeptidase/D-alanyl-D-alanine-endopeptidase [Actinobacteria bacterium]|nr:D-alanyl-D-alanine carboxypeptidase/D-alanyl-D-alanine-endopeptidase [Actinomycetota bacterium]MCB8996457.1 D-alanyl-D-alanine carboxypeptidase/D-alanyl-D-alanine-endopeptidase [Actinomycetota bacterium]MCB9425285.1 D-alanyl-D-alanine carboxypeptidase/D-alanyl-D-alanine-endopeptidase [Actinomycetota bacterium]HRY08755.1 D-alanyl-D-alanine carboxypeptidase/D-alanyl-D-alanine-endopeptidase [Candidatus Nanopelagicales bacterium]